MSDEIEIYAGDSWETTRLSFAWLHDSIDKMVLACSCEKNASKQTINKRMAALKKLIPTAKEHAAEAIEEIQSYIPVNQDGAKAADVVENSLLSLEKITDDASSFKDIEKILSDMRNATKAMDM